MELYVHIPFCQRKCRYCDFPSYAGCEDMMSAYVDAVLAEARFRSEELNFPALDTIFLGGGTPSLLSPKDLGRLLEGISRSFSVPDHIEFTSEANPGTLTREWLDTAVFFGVNRLSMGMQAYQPRLLKTLGRIHSFEQVLESVFLARKAGISNLNLDLMFGLPGQTEDDWRETLGKALSLGPQHLSCYGLIPEEGTPLKTDLDAGKLILPDEDAERRMYDVALDRLASNGFQQYEISNFALPGFECKHNLGYWQHVPYLGIGASASSMLMDVPGCFCQRETNPSTLNDYFAMVEQRAWQKRETINVSPDEGRFESIMLGLRTTKGIDEAHFLRLHGTSLESVYGLKLYKLLHGGLIAHEDEYWKLTRRGMDVQNAILVELMDE